MKSGCSIVADVGLVAAAFDRPRLAHLNCPVETLITDPPITAVNQAEQAFWDDGLVQERLAQISAGSILAIGYAPSVVLTACQLIEQW